VKFVPAKTVIAEVPASVEVKLQDHLTRLICSRSLPGGCLQNTGKNRFIITTLLQKTQTETGSDNLYGR
jgi:hypothetical protein